MKEVQNNQAGLRSTDLFPQPAPTPDSLSLPDCIARVPKRSQYSAEVFEAICRAVEDGTCPSFNSACRKYEIPPADLYYWSGCDPRLAERLARAKKAHARTLASESADISRRLEEFEINRPDDYRFASAWVNSLRASAQIKMDLAKRLCPEEFGDKVQIDNPDQAEQESLPELLAKLGEIIERNSDVFGSILNCCNPKGIEVVDVTPNERLESNAPRQPAIEAPSTGAPGGTQAGK